MHASLVRGGLVRRLSGNVQRATRSAPTGARASCPTSPSPTKAFSISKRSGLCCRKTSRQHAGLGDQDGHAPLRIEPSEPAVRTLHMGSASILLALAGMLPASYIAYPRLFFASGAKGSAKVANKMLVFAFARFLIGLAKKRRWMNSREHPWCKLR